MRYEINQRYNSRRDRCTDDDVVHQNDSSDSGCNAEHCREDYRNPHGGRLAVLRADVPAVKTPAKSVGVLVEVSVVAPRIVLIELEDTNGSRYVSAVGLEGDAGAHDKVYSVNVADEVVDVVVAEGRRNDVAARFPCRKLTGIGVRRAGELKHRAGGFAGLEHEELVLSVELLGYRGLALERGVNEELRNLGNYNMLERDGGNGMTRLFLELLAGFYIPVYLILMDIVVAAVFSVIVVRIKEPKVELYVVSLGGVDGQVVRAATVKLGVCVICEAAGERLIIGKLLVAADGAALIGIVVAENEGEGDASVRNGLEYRLYSGIDSLCGLDFAARYLVACKYDEVGLFCVESFFHEHYHGFSRYVDILRVGNLHYLELSVLVEAQNTVVVDCRKSGRRRGYKHRRAEHNGEQSLDFLTHDSFQSFLYSVRVKYILGVTII